MKRLLWLPGGTVIHLGRWLGPLRFEAECSYLGPTEPAGDGWPDSVTSATWNDPGGRVVHGAWPHELDRLPDRPICSACKARWAHAVAEVEAILAARP